MNADTQPNYPDALIDRGLAELVGGQSPPDLSERILAAAQANQSEPITLAEGTHAMSTVKRSSRPKSWAILAASITCVGAAIGLMTPSSREAQDLARLAQRKAEEVDRTQRRLSGKDDSDALMMTVTPKIIIQEEEEERLGIAEEGSAPTTETDSASVSDGEMILLGGMKPKSSSGAAGPQSKDTISLESVLRSASSRRSQEQESLERGGRKTSETGTYFEFASRPESRETAEEQKKEATLPSPYYLSDDVQHSAPKQNFSIDERNFDWSAGSRENLARRPARGEPLAFDIDARFRQKSLDVQGQINDAYADDLSSGFSLGFPYKPQQGTGPGKSGDQYTRIYENPFITAKGGDAVSTFSIDVDTASYANVRQFLQSGQLPPPDAVRIEELVNYFPYDYEGPKDDTPFTAHMEVAACPWNPQHRLARIAIKGKEIDRKVRPQSNLVFLIDVSGSMNEPAKLPLLVDGMKLLTRELGENDKVAIVVYASSEGSVLPSTRGDQQQTILTALDNLQAGGSTAGGAGINLAYQVAQENFIKGGVNRVILCTDGDFNVGVSDTAALTRLAEEKARDSKVFLTVLGFGRGNLNDAMMEAISGKGNGNYHYVDNLTEARKVLVEEMSGTLVTIAKDVKIQVEFNPAQVAGYRLIGYENRMLRTEDFNDDKKDAGEIGAGHTVTALYEIIPPGETVGTASVDPLKYQTPNPPLGTPGGARGGSAEQPANVASDELLTLKLRYKLPDADTSTKVEFPITDQGGSFADATDDFQFAAAVASFGMLLRNSEYKGNSTFDAALEIAQSTLSEDPHGYRGEFLELVRQARELKQ